MRDSLSLLDATGEVATIIGSPYRGAGWYGPTGGLHTVCISVSNFIGRISIQGTLAGTPNDGDWFSLLPGGLAYWQYPRAGFAVQSPSTGETSTVGFNFTANVVWLRATLDRTYLANGIMPATALAGMGLIDSILVNY